MILSVEPRLPSLRAGPAGWAGRQRGELAPTKSYSRRAWQWEPEDGLHSDPRDGTLYIYLTVEGKRITRTEVFEYAVQEELDEELPEGVRSFLLENVREPDPDGPLRCVVGGLIETCSCEAGCFDRVRREPTDCKHRAALRAMIEEGAI